MDRPSLRTGELTHPHVWPHISTHQVSLAHTGTHTLPLHLRVLRFCLDGGHEKCLTGLTSEDPGGKKMSGARIQLRDMKQTKKFPKPNRAKKLINVSVPLVIKQECTHKYSQNSKVRPR